MSDDPMEHLDRIEARQRHPSAQRASEGDGEGLERTQTMLSLNIGRGSVTFRFRSVHPAGSVGRYVAVQRLAEVLSRLAPNVD